MDSEALVKEARLDAKAFRENTVYDSEGDPVRLTANAYRLDQYADAIEALQAENARLREEIGRMRGPVLTYEKGYGVGDGAAALQETGQ